MGYLDTYRGYWGDYDGGLDQRFGTFSRAMAGRDDLSLRMDTENTVAHIKGGQAITVSHPKVIQKVFKCSDEDALTVSKAQTNHEAAHAKFTPAKRYENALMEHYARTADQEDMLDYQNALNALEDTRVDLAQMNKRPGYKVDRGVQMKHTLTKLAHQKPTLNHGVFKWMMEVCGTGEYNLPVGREGEATYQWLKDNVDAEALKNFDDVLEATTELYKAIRKIKGKPEYSQSPARDMPQEGSEGAEGEPKGKKKPNQGKGKGQQKQGEADGNKGDDSGEGAGEGDESGDGSDGGAEGDGADDGGGEGDGGQGAPNAAGENPAGEGGTQQTQSGVQGGRGASGSKPTFEYDAKTALTENIVETVHKERLQEYIEEVEKDASEDDLSVMYKAYEAEFERLGKMRQHCVKQSFQEFVQTRRMTATPQHKQHVVARYKYKNLFSSAEGTARRNAQQFESQAKMLADVLKRIMDDASSAVKSKNGSLTARRAYKYQHSKYVFHKNQQDTGGYAVSLLLDASGSMGSSREATRKVAYLLGRAFVLAGVPLQILQFYSSGDCTHVFELKGFDETDATLTANYHTDNSNRDGVAILLAGRELMERPEENKILVVLSDGQPASNGRAHASWGIGTAKAPEYIHGYGGDFDTATGKLEGEGALDVANTVRKFRGSGVHVGGVFIGRGKGNDSARMLATLNAMYGNDFAYITDMGRLSHVMAQFFERFVSK